MGKKNHDGTAVSSSELLELFQIASAISMDMVIDRVPEQNTVTELQRVYNEKGVSYGNARTYSLTKEERKAYDKLASEKEKMEFVGNLLNKHIGRKDKSRTEFFTSLEVSKMLMQRTGTILDKDGYNFILQGKPDSVREEEINACLNAPTLTIKK